MSEFLLTKPSGEQMTVKVNRTGDQVEVILGGKVIRLSEIELKDWKGKSQLNNGNLFVSSETLQRSFDFSPYRKQKDGAGGVAQNQLKALFPGKIVKILAKENSWCEESDLLVVMESMKMEYDYKAPQKLFIEKILVKEGQVLSKGEEFFQFHV